MQSPALPLPGASVIQGNQSPRIALAAVSPPKVSFESYFAGAGIVEAGTGNIAHRSVGFRHWWRPANRASRSTIQGKDHSCRPSPE